MIDKEILKIPKVDNIKIENFGIIKNASIEFASGLNIIAGKSASGKTTLIKYLKEKMLENLSLGEQMKFEIDKELNDTTILIDDALQRLDTYSLIEMLNKLSSCKRQVIITLYSWILNKIKDKIEANIIYAKDFELKSEA